MSSSNNKTGNADASNNNNNGGGKSTPMTGADASRIQSGQATGGKDMSSGGFAARAQSAADKNAAAEKK